MIKFLLTMTALVALSACSNHEGNEWERLVCEVESVNGGVPLMSFYVLVTEGNDTEVYPIDLVPIVFRARPYSNYTVMSEDSPQSVFQITSYDLIWHPIGDAPEGLTDHNISRGMTSVSVPVYEDAIVSVLVADRVMKEEPWFSGLQFTGESFTASCELIFYGHESGNTREVAIPTGFMVTFYGTGLDE